MVSQVKELQSKVDELEQELEDLEFGSYSYDTVSAELEYHYSLLFKAKEMQ